ncbi:MAG: tetratricopeptide repeat protein [Calditrichota bacterium]
MKKLFGGKTETEQSAREYIRKKKWSKAIAVYEQKLQERERDFALWNRLGDLHMNNKSHAQAVEAWRRAIDGYAAEGLHENVLGISKKMLRLAPEEEDVQLVLADAYLGLEYYADCLSALRSYLKLAKHPSEQELRSFIRKILGTTIKHRHLLDELKSIYADSGIEDFELQQKLDEYVQAAEQAENERAPRRAAVEGSATETDVPTVSERSISRQGDDGLIVLDGMDSYAEADDNDFGTYRPSYTTSSHHSPAEHTSYETPQTGSDHTDLPAGEGKDHYDLGIVYKEMKLWDAAVAEFEQARKDNSVRLKATLALAECLHEMHDLQGALDLLERERSDNSGTPEDQLELEYQLGNLHELLGNIDEALTHFETVREQNPGYSEVENKIADLSNRRTAGE